MPPPKPVTIDLFFLGLAVVFCLYLFCDCFLVRNWEANNLKADSVGIHIHACLLFPWNMYRTIYDIEVFLNHNCYDSFLVKNGILIQNHNGQ